MQEKLIQVITKNDETKVSSILSSISANNKLSVCKIILIDDSYNPSVLTSNSSSVRKSPLDIDHIKSDDWMEYKSVILWKLDSPFVDKLDIWLAQWNTPNVRNVWHVIANLKYPNSSNIIHFDDDMEVSNLNIDTPGDFLGIPITWCPDLSRIEWIQLYIRHLSETYKVVSNEEYYDKLLMLFNSDQIQNFISTYTDLLPSNSLKNHPLLLPSRQEFSWWAYINSLYNTSISTFPYTYNEDWCYSGLLNQRLNTENRFIAHSSVEHRSSVKQILDSQYLMNEELWEITQLYFRLEDKSLFSNIIDSKISMILDELDICGSISINSTNFNKIQTISKELNNLLDFYKALKSDYSQIIEIYQTNVEDTIDWQSISKQLPYLLKN